KTIRKKAMIKRKRIEKTEEDFKTDQNKYCVVSL
ncbi:unnamed protein product, partial [marine sediment metagenome]